MSAFSNLHFRRPLGKLLAMTHLAYYGTPGPWVPHRTGLIVWGSLLIAAGALFVCGGLFGMAGVVFISTQASGGGASSPAIVHTAGSLLAALAIYGSVIWLGIGCCLGNRWSRPLVLVGSVMSIVLGAASIVPATYAAWQMFNGGTFVTPTTAPTTAPAFMPGSAPPVAAAIGGVIGLFFMICLMIVAPALMFQFFRQETVRQSLEMTDLKRRWTDDVPLPLLGWVVGSVVFGGHYVSTGLSGIFPFFTSIIVGPAATVALLIIGLLLIFGGWLSYRRSTVGWAMVMAVLALLAASQGTFALLGDTVAYRHMLLDGFGPMIQKQVDISAYGINPFIVPAVISVLAGGYGVWLWPRYKMLTARPASSAITSSEMND